MRWIAFLGCAAWMSLAACGDDGHDHEHEDHEHEDHDHEGHEHEEDHDHEGHEDHDHEDHDHGGHDHEDDLTLTAQSETLELFAILHPEAAQVEVEAHLTRLSDFQPLSGELRCSYAGEACHAEPLSPGIFAITLASLHEGGQHEIALTLSQGEGDGALSVTTPLHAAHAPEDASAIHFTKEQQWSIAFRTGLPVEGRLRESVEVLGELQVPPGQAVTLSASIAGRLSAAEDFPRPGMRVRRGQLLATLAPAPSSPEAAAQAQLSLVDAQARQEAALAEVARTERLLAQGAIPERRVSEAQRGLRVAEEAVAAARRARALFAAAQSGSRGGAWRIVAPIEGVVEQVFANPGESVELNQPLLSILNAQTLWVHLHVPEIWAPRLQRDAAGEFQLMGDPRWRALILEGEEANASLVHLGQSVDEATRAVSVIYALAPSEAESTRDPALRVGSSLRALLPVGEPQAGLIIESGALLDAEGRDVVMVQLDGEHFVERDVRIALKNGSHALVISGLRPEERIVTQGAQFVRLASSRVTEAGHGHVH